MYYCVIDIHTQLCFRVTQRKIDCKVPADILPTTSPSCRPLALLDTLNHTHVLLLFHTWGILSYIVTCEPEWLVIPGCSHTLFTSFIQASWDTLLRALFWILLWFSIKTWCHIKMCSIFDYSFHSWSGRSWHKVVVVFGCFFNWPFDQCAIEHYSHSFYFWMNFPDLILEVELGTLVWNTKTLSLLD